MNRKYDQKKPASVLTHALGSEEELERLVNGEAVNEPFPAPLEAKPTRTTEMLFQYVVPCAIPVGLAAALYPFLPAAAASSALAPLAAPAKVVVAASNDAGEVGLPALAAADFVEDSAGSAGTTAAAVGEPGGGDFDYAAELEAAEEAEEVAEEAEAEEVAAEIAELAEELAEMEGSSDPDQFVEEAAAEVEELEALEIEVAQEKEWDERRSRLKRRVMLR